MGKPVALPGTPTGPGIATRAGQPLILTEIVLVTDVLEPSAFV